MKKFWKIFGWICLGILIEFKFDVIAGTVYLENYAFHDRTYYVQMNMTPASGDLQILKVHTIVHHSLGPDYFATVYIPNFYKVINKKPYMGAEAIPGYTAYNMNMKRKYRDVLSTEDFIIQPNAVGGEIPATPVLIDFLNLKQSLHKDNTYQLVTSKNRMQLEGPEIAGATYPQKLGM
ncbi:MAG: hypothetical protein GWM98_27185 [Nitrospinaceae bacterium]|nr:hypothetical protein [Nitrospinaceae bacterium]NIR57468.1 hypothetical protein [Nitrospinaceae bacterium]NIS87935.1 hypothetical protein [Nitrospinaceae bacterium]NIT84803.1 hypothetical protein [Nitrospinaceae bacterium]NIU46979.1 hypothetical protein [Nitrospinaceae bacterium]